MLLNLYTTTDDTRVLNKTLSAIKNINAIPVDGVTLLNPQFIVEYDSSILNANYCYISELQRYYYITNIVLMRGNRIQFNCAVDVLKTYANEIRECTATVVRSESIGAPTMVPDNKLPINPNKKELKTAVYQFKGSAATDVHTPRYFMKIKYSPTAYIPSNERGE